MIIMVFQTWKPKAFRQKEDRKTVPDQTKIRNKNGLDQRPEKNLS